MNSVMNNIQLYIVLVLVLLVGASCSKQEKHPNIILVMTDDQGWFDAGFNGNDQIMTPNLDKMAAEGIVLKRFYSGSAVCSPTRASLITGRNPNRMGIPDANSGKMLKQEITIAELLKPEGYSTGHFGKWHLGTFSTTEKDANRGGKGNTHYSIPSQHGYDEFFATESKVPTYNPMAYPADFEGYESKRFGWDAAGKNDSVRSFGTSYWKAEGVKATENLEGDDARVIMDRVIPFIQKSLDKKQPFFTTVWFHTPHLPVVASKDYRDMYPDASPQEKIYRGTITAMDVQMGRLWQFLEDKGINKNTMIWFCSDNGPERNTPGNAGIYRERKRSLYEGGLRVPAFVVWKSKLKSGGHTDYPMVTSDYLPTIVDYLKLDYPDQRPLDGKSVREAIEGKVDLRNEPIGFKYKKKISWVTDRYKLISTNNGKDYELYDLFVDPSEENNVIEEEPELASAMQKSLGAWLSSVKRSNEGEDY